MTIEDIQQLIKHGETRTLELKKSTGELKDAMHSACAMLNTDGGYLIFGITPVSLKIVGQQVTDNTRQEIANATSNLEPAIDIKPEYIDIDDNGNQLIILHLNSWTNGSPVYTYLGCPYYKQESTTKRMPRDMFDERLKASNPTKFQWDTKIADDVSIADLDEERIRGAVRLGVRGGRLHASADGDSVVSLLHKLKLLTSSDQLTNAAAMLFLKDTNPYPQFLLRVCRFRGVTKNIFIDPQEIYGNFFDILDAGIAFCFKHLFLTGEVVGLHRQETLEIPVEALREAIINALCHRDYEQPYASVSLAIFDDRVEITNPGMLPAELTPETILLPHDSYPHNPLIAQVLYLTTYLDKWGTGVNRMIDLCQNANIPSPKYSIDNKSVKITFERPNIQTGEDNSFDFNLAQVSAQVKLLIQCIGNDALSLSDLMNLPKFAQVRSSLPKSIRSLRREALNPAIKSGYISMLYPDRPNHPHQKYFLTDSGKNILK